MGGWVLDFTRLMPISTQVEVVVEVGVGLGKIFHHGQNPKKVMDVDEFNKCCSMKVSQIRKGPLSYSTLTILFC